LPVRCRLLAFTLLNSRSYAWFVLSLSSFVDSTFESPEYCFCRRFIPYSCVYSFGIRISVPFIGRLISGGSVVSSITFNTGCSPGRSLTRIPYKTERRLRRTAGGGSPASSAVGRAGAVRKTPSILLAALFWIDSSGAIDRLSFYQTGEL
jgi:hypothetical protein